jgi:hypothetical protein
MQTSLGSQNAMWALNWSKLIMGSFLKNTSNTKRVGDAIVFDMKRKGLNLLQALPQSNMWNLRITREYIKTLKIEGEECMVYDLWWALTIDIFNILVNLCLHLGLPMLYLSRHPDTCEDKCVQIYTEF